MTTPPVVSAPFFLNSPEEIKKRVSLGQIRWAAPLLFLPARIVFMLLSQGIFATVFWLQGRASPWRAAGPWWTVWGTLVDVGCLACLFFLTRRENIRIRDLLGPLPRWLVPKGIACFALIFPFFLVGGPLASWIVYHAWQAPIPIGEMWARHLPLWGVLYSLLIWWPIWSVTEEFTYQGYLASRLAALSRHRWVRLLPGGILVGVAALFSSVRARLAARSLQVSRLPSRRPRFHGDLLTHAKTCPAHCGSVDDGYIRRSDDPLVLGGRLFPLKSILSFQLACLGFSANSGSVGWPAAGPLLSSPAAAFFTCPLPDR